MHHPKTYIYQGRAGWCHSFWELSYWGTARRWKWPHKCHGFCFLPRRYHTERIGIHEVGNKYQNQNTSYEYRKRVRLMSLLGRLRRRGVRRSWSEAVLVQTVSGESRLWSFIPNHGWILVVVVMVSVILLEAPLCKILQPITVGHFVTFVNQSGSIEIFILGFVQYLSISGIEL